MISRTNARFNINGIDFDKVITSSKLSGYPAVIDTWTNIQFTTPEKAKFVIEIYEGAGDSLVGLYISDVEQQKTILCGSTASSAIPPSTVSEVPYDLTVTDNSLIVGSRNCSGTYFNKMQIVIFY